MKKFLCAVLVFIMAFSAVFPAFAADTDPDVPTVIEKTGKISIEEGKPLEYTYTVPEDAAYRLYASPSGLGGACMTVSLNGVAYDESLIYSFEDRNEDGTYKGCTCMVAADKEIFMKSGTKVDVKFELNPEKFICVECGTIRGYQPDRVEKPFEFEFEFSYYNVHKMNIGENRSLNEYEYYAFTPDETGVYTFSSSTAKGIASYAELYEENGEIIWTACLADSETKKDGSGDFDMTARLTAGESYLIDFYMEDADEKHVENGKIDCTVTRETGTFKVAFSTVEYYVNNFVKKVKSFFNRITDKIREALAPFFEKVSAFLK